MGLGYGRLRYCSDGVRRGRVPPDVILVFMLLVREWSWEGLVRNTSSERSWYCVALTMNMWLVIFFMKAVPGRVDRAGFFITGNMVVSFLELYLWLEDHIL